MDYNALLAELRQSPHITKASFAIEQIQLSLGHSSVRA
jgi:hypothetical protein